MRRAHPARNHLYAVVSRLLPSAHGTLSTFTPHLDTGDFVVVINAEKVVLTGKKETEKVMTTYSGYRGGLKKFSPADVRAKHPERLVEKAVKGMIPRNRLGRQIFKKLKVYAGPDHPHKAQAPATLELA